MEDVAVIHRGCCVATLLVVLWSRTLASDIRKVAVDAKDEVQYESDKTLWTTEKFPNPQTDPVSCGRDEQPSWICDPGKTLKKHEADEIDLILDEFRGTTPCACDGCTNTTLNQGFFLAVAIVNEMYTEQEHMNDLDKLKLTERFSRELRKSRWKFGECENDAVIVVSPEYRKAWTSTGSRFAALVSPWCVNFIYKEVRLSLWEGNYTSGIRDMVTMYKMVLAGDMKCEEGIRAGTVIFALAIFFFGLVFIVSFGSFFRQRFHLCEKQGQEV